MKRILFANIFFTTFMISGCSTSWEPMGQTILTLDESKNVCNTESLTRFPIKNEVAQRTVQKQVAVKCKAGGECPKSGYRYENKPALESYSMDVNKQSRNEDFSICMEKNGWRRDTKWF